LINDDDHSGNILLKITLPTVVSIGDSPSSTSVILSLSLISEELYD
jgi:hypothetical protein